MHFFFFFCGKKIFFPREWQNSLVFKKRLKGALLLYFSFWTYFRNSEYKTNVLVSLFPFKKKVETNSQGFSLIGFWGLHDILYNEGITKLLEKNEPYMKPGGEEVKQMIWSKETPFFILIYKGLRHMWTSHFIYTAHWFNGVFLIRILVFNELRLTLLS